MYIGLENIYVYYIYIFNCQTSITTVQNCYRNVNHYFEYAQMNDIDNNNIIITL